MDHLIREGHANVRIALRKNDSSLKMASMYHGTPDPLLGTTLYENIRTSSRDLLELLFLPEKIQEDEKGVSDTRHPKQFLGALGSSNSSEGKYQGFGNSPIMKEETVADKVLNYFDKLSTTSDQNSKIIKEGIASSIGNYEAVSLPNIQQFAMPIAKPMPSLPPPPRVSAMKEHVPGKAGGGWEDSDEDEPKTSHHPSLLSEDSLETCIKLSCPEVLRAIADELKPPAASTRALILLDALLNCELLASTRAVTEARQMLDQVLAKIVDDSSAPNLNRNKAAKIVQSVI
ncbi:hypothetical protein B566_EDAN006645 [Ephemera danica]|nr:hypothetical protein B566_EDAN006645 [Ephemera danica]